jgi:hypothetical protein
MSDDEGTLIERGRDTEKGFVLQVSSQSEVKWHTWCPRVVGRHTITFSAADKLGRRAETQVHVEIEALDSLVVQIISPVEGGHYRYGEKIELRGRVSDESGPLEYAGGGACVYVG